jgi:hypothetical protein
MYIHTVILSSKKNILDVCQPMYVVKGIRKGDGGGRDGQDGGKQL